MSIITKQYQSKQLNHLNIDYLLFDLIAFNIGEFSILSYNEYNWKPYGRGNMKKGIFQSAFVLSFCVLLFVFTCKKLFSAELASIDFKQKNEISVLELSFSNVENLKVKKINVTEDKQIILDLASTTATEKIMREFDTSEFSGSAIFVRPYTKGDGALRVAVQLRDNVRSILKREGNKVLLELENRFGAFSEAVVKGETGVIDFSDLEKSEAQTIGDINVPKSQSVSDILENLTLSGKKKYIGSRISFSVKDGSVEDILMMIADSSGFNIIMSDEVKKLPPLTLTLMNTPWDQILDTVLELNKLVVKKNGMILIVGSLDKAVEEEKKKLEAKKSAKSLEPLITKIFSISYAKLQDLEKIVKPYLTENRGQISMDPRTNSFIVKDTSDSIERIRMIIEALDTQTPQVLIESKIVEVVEGYSKQFGLEKGIKAGFDPISPLPSALADRRVGPGFMFNTASMGSSGLMNLQIGRLSQLINLDLTLQMLETESKAKIVSSPRVITKDNMPAVISGNDTEYFKPPDSSSSSSSSGGEAAKWTEQTLKMELKVTPQITNEGAINLEVDLSKDTKGEVNPDSKMPAKLARNLKTNVLVDNGSTISLGGLYTYSNTESHSGIPFLKDIPLLGWLFRSAYNPKTNKSELVVFITPRIVNQEESGLSEGNIKDTL